MARSCTSGHYWDGLVKQCMSCQMMCEQPEPHARCMDFCATTRTTGVFALPPLNTRGSHKTRGVPYSEALVYSLLGLCLAMLLSTMIVALLVLLRRARVQKEHREKKPQQTSKDCLMVEAITQEANGVVPDRPRATETCVHCFTEQTIPQCLNGDPQRRHHYTNGVAHGHASRTMCERDDALRIICSPTQTSI
ncbi:tumor necrosis factor receptor superfamily member 13B isoform X2 [Pygocentrus nattereri]|uniref:tumor necrosis factor receptor superfamily member 13B isoform X2 n=1 Tax=Pygocentrus nattereri TaxID=42514 RepID=UPI00081446B3|nr:tumor necrosis factor receptor superfamily member 13B isoform X2 [Pygocentrus nattereri]